MPTVWGVIPARFGSTRFPGKPIAKIKNKELIAWVIDGAKKSKLLDKLIVATDDVRIAEIAFHYSTQAIMTDSELPSGSDRIWAAVKGKSIDIVVNIQGDEPLVTGELIDALVQPMLNDSTLEMATLAHPISLEELRSENSVKVVVNAQSEALYFSRFAIPYSRMNPELENGIVGVMKHIGMYAYKTSFLEKYCALAPVALEKAESLEQLRALYLGARIKVVKTEQKSWGVDTPEDIITIEKMLKNRE